MRKILMLSATCALLACEAGEKTTNNETAPSNGAVSSESGRPKEIQEAAKDAGIPAVSLLTYSPVPPDDNGEIAKMIRDPAKRPVEIMKNYRDHAEEQLGIGGDAKKIINDPIKCTLGKLIKKC